MVLVYCENSQHKTVLITIDAGAHLVVATNATGETVGEVICCEPSVCLDAFGYDEFALLASSADVDEIYEKCGQTMLANITAYTPHQNGSHLTDAGKAFAGTPKDYSFRITFGRHRGGYHMPPERFTNHNPLRTVALDEKYFSHLK